jgi:predicted DsbA family dithiol-disulfide isomerase
MTIEVKVWSDFVCPFCMIAEKPLLDAIAASGLDVSLQWMPFELRPYPAETLRPEDSYLQSVWPQSVYPMAERHGVTLKLPSVSPQPHTGLAWEGYQFALEQGRGNAYNDRMLKAFFQEDRDIGDLDVLTQLAGELGLDQASFRSALEQQRYRAQHQQALLLAQDMGVQAVPTILIGERLFSGVQSEQTLLEALRQEAEG